MTDGSRPAGKPNVLDQVLAQRQGVTRRLAQIRHTVAIMSGKGGVGKSALTANLAALLGQRGRTVGVLDADIHGPSAAAMLGARGQQLRTFSTGVRPALGVSGVRVMSMDLFLDGDDTPVSWHHPGGLAADTFVWRGSLEAGALREFLSDTDWGTLDYLLIDMPPGADRFETLLRLAPELTGALVVTIPSRASHMVVKRAITSARDAGGRLLGLVENMAGVGFKDANPGEDFADRVGLPCLGVIPFDPQFARATDAGRPFVLEHEHTATGMEIVALADRFEEVVTR